MITSFKILHLVALMFGSLAALGNIYLALAKGPQDQAAAAFTNTLRKYYRFTGLAAIIILWASGLLLLTTKYGAWVPGPAFSAKIAFVLLLTAINLFVNFMAPKWARSGGPPSYVPILHRTGAVSLILIVVLAVVAFG